MRSSELPPDKAARYHRIFTGMLALMESEGVTNRREVLENLSMMCADVAKVEGPECLDFVEGVIQGWYEDQSDKCPD